MATIKYTVEADAYYKLYFHAAKHPHKPVNGVLVGTQDGPGKPVTIIDSIPLLHHWTSLSPMMEIGLDLAFQHAGNEGLKIVGYYQACERLEETILAPVGEKVAGKIKANFEDAIAFVIDGQRLGNSGAALVPYISSSSSWRPAPNDPPPFTPGSRFQLASSDLPAEAARLVLEQNSQFAFGDFDDHLEDVTIGPPPSRVVSRPSSTLALGNFHRNLLVLSCRVRHGLLSLLSYPFAVDARALSLDIHDAPGIVYTTPP
ncbi:hypothetical protein NLJ89_g6597 [Agrocybe chaxingu]|uniref:MPN domain-containing protein n=1 Tax=Agrocybe chaxingu TaxID=84603 RepID=A0A9W8JYG5_9AGAR|nr:hypothetical protein NLJ89_g6597 [Agrocybe chaxingu]